MCPGKNSENSEEYVIHLPADGNPKVGDVLITCPNHPNHVIRWDASMLCMLRYFK
jgi:hypothetical protein